MVAANHNLGTELLVFSSEAHGVVSDPMSLVIRYNVYMMLHLFLSTLAALGVILALTKKYAKAGLILLALSFLSLAVVAYVVDKDVVQSIIYAVVVVGSVYELTKARRGNYHLTKKAKLITCVVFIMLGVWYATLGIISPFLVAGVVGLAVGLVEP